MVADKPCWTEPQISGYYGECKVAAPGVNQKFVAIGRRTSTIKAI